MSDDQTLTILIAIGPGEQPVPDLREKLPDPHHELPCREDALRDWLAEWAVDAEAWLDRLEHLLRQDALSWLKLANKAGILVSGFDTVEKALRGGKLALTLHGSDARPDGLRKLGGLAHDLPSIHLFSSEELGAVIGRSQAVHLGLTADHAKAGLRESFLRSCQRLAGFRPQARL